MHVLHLPPLLVSGDAALMWKELYGCSSEPNRKGWSDSTTTCTSMCGGKKARLELCGMKGVGHNVDTPVEGYPFTIAW